MIILVLAAKFILPLLFLVSPFVSSLLNFILDTADGDILMHFGMSYDTYQTWDKAADYFSYIMMVLAAYRWVVKKQIINLFILRTIGQILFFLTRNDLFFVIFPNFLEPFFMIYAFLLLVKKDKAHDVYEKYKVPIWIGIVMYKMWNEMNIHYFRLDLSTVFFGFNN